MAVPPATPAKRLGSCLDEVGRLAEDRVLPPHRGSEGHLPATHMSIEPFQVAPLVVELRGALEAVDHHLAALSRTGVTGVTDGVTGVMGVTGVTDGVTDSPEPAV